MLPISVDTIRLFLHVLGATIWVGGQITMLWLLNTVKAQGEAAPQAVASRFNNLAWGGLALLIVTGIWHIFAINVGSRTIEWQVTFALKLAFVAISAIGVGWHIYGRSKVALAVGGTLGFVFAIVALFYGILLHG